MIQQDKKIHLASYAMKEEDSRGRKHSRIEPHPYRSIYQRDRDRIIHSTAFRRLEYKTQVFVYNEGDYYRTRLTHSIEVSQIARTIANVLGLNGYLVEAIALAHDLGHPPFGHRGEEILEALMKKQGGFNHNCHALRIVDKLEKRYPAFRGLDLTYEVREGLIKHSTDYDCPTKLKGFNHREMPTLEAQVVDIADEIAYNNHDLDDGLTSQLIAESQLDELPLWKEANQSIKKKFGQLPAEIKKYQIIRYLIDKLINDLIKQSQNNIKIFKIKNVKDVRRAKRKIISFSPAMRKQLQPMKNFLKKNFYNHPRIILMADKSSRILGSLFDIYTKSELALPKDFQVDLKTDGKYRVACDYIASMTDRSALDEYKKLFDPDEKI